MAVDGVVVTELGVRADPATQKITLDGRPIPAISSRRHYVALHKPRGITTTLSDSHASRTVAPLVDLPGKPLLRPVGRLDNESEGLLFLSDDGAFIHHLTHPRFHVPKTYLATVTGTPSQESLKQLAEGVELDDGVTAPAERVRLVKSFPASDTSDVEITIHEGRKRQVRRMMAAVGHPVRRLVRTAIGSITLGSLPSGAWRHLTPAEVDRLMKSPDPAQQSESKPQPSGPGSRIKSSYPNRSRSTANGKSKRYDRDKQGHDQGAAIQRPRAHHGR